MDKIKEKREKEAVLLENIRNHEEVIRTLAGKMASAQVTEDAIYRFYHDSYKVFNVQHLTEEAVTLLLSLLPGTSFWEIHPSFREIYSQGAQKTFTREMNLRWTYETRPILEAFHHTRHLMEMTVKYGLDRDEQGREGMPGWFTVLYFFRIR